MPISDIKQIAGRAGRYRTADHDTLAKSTSELASHESLQQLGSTNLGLVTCLEDIDLQILQRAMRSNAPSLQTAGLTPPEPLVLRFASYFPPRTPFSYILLRLHEISRLHPRFHLCDMTDSAEIADAIQQVEDLTLAERLNFCAAPVPTREESL